MEFERDTPKSNISDDRSDGKYDVIGPALSLLADMDYQKMASRDRPH